MIARLSGAALAIALCATQSVAEESIIPATDFDRSAWISQAAIPGTMAPDVVGAFRFLCMPSHLGYNDPIVNPGQDGGAAHLHQFFGNDKTDAFSTYESLRTAGNGTCHGGPLNRSAYWIPAMLDGKGNVVVPDNIVVYYKGLPGGATKELPRGLRYIFGHDMATPDAPLKVQWQCIGGGTGLPLARTIADAIVNGCTGAGATLNGALSGPNCWDGINLDSSNHRSHMSGKVSGVCPTTHPVELATLTISATYQIAAGDNVSLWHLASDRQNNMNHAPGSTFHADWWGAWDDAVKKTWHDNCIGKMLSGVSGSLCNGTALKQPANFAFVLDPAKRLIPIPARPAPTPIIVEPPPAPPPAAMYEARSYKSGRNTRWQMYFNGEQKLTDLPLYAVEWLCVRFEQHGATCAVIK